MAFYVRGNAIEHATGYKLYKKLGGNLINFASPASAPDCWAYDAQNNTWTMTDSEYQNLRWNFTVSAGTTINWTFEASSVQGSLVGTLRDSANTTLANATKMDDGKYGVTYTIPSDGEYSIRICGTATPNSAVISNVSVTTGGDEYTLIGTQSLGKQQAKFDGHIASNGNWATAELGSTWASTGLIHVSALADDENGHCVTGLTEDSTKYAAAFYSDYTEESPVEKFVGGMLYSELDELDADTIRQYAAARGAKYVIFAAADKSNLFVNLTKDIFFDLRVYWYQGKLPSGQTHTLVVQAVGEGGVDLNGDGTIHEDSDYSNEVDYEA